jgi:hypothetical protein
MDETSLFCKLLPSTTLASKRTEGHNISKERITLALCVSATGDNLKPIIICKSANPRCFNSPKFYPQNFCHYYLKSSAWMTKIIFKSWVTDMNRLMTIKNRHTLLLHDNFSGHILEKEHLSHLSNVLSNYTIIYIINYTVKSTVNQII